MYYRWTSKAINCQDYKNLADDINKWYRESYSSFIKALPNYYDLQVNGYLEIKDESNSPKQWANRKLWELEGRTLACFRQVHLLVETYKVFWPQEWNYYQSYTWQQMNKMDQLNWFLDKLRKQRESNKRENVKQVKPQVPT